MLGRKAILLAMVIVVGIGLIGSKVAAWTGVTAESRTGAAADQVAAATVILESQGAAVPSSIEDQYQQGQRPPAGQHSRSVHGRTPCTTATPADERACATLERHILASTVRFEITGPDITDEDQRSEKIGHGTVKDGRYLVVHNHFSVDLTVFADERYAGEAHISMYTGIGDLFVWQARPPLFTVSIVGPETLVLDFGADSKGVGFFESRGLQSANFTNWQRESPHAGQEVAQVVWDYRRSTVDWVIIEDVITVNSVPRLILSTPLLPGASGGGVFWNGAHIAVNWQTGRVLGGSGEVLEQFSTAALNSNRNADILEAELMYHIDDDLSTQTLSSYPDVVEGRR